MLEGACRSVNVSMLKATGAPLRWGDIKIRVWVCELEQGSEWGLKFACYRKMEREKRSLIESDEAKKRKRFLPLPPHSVSFSLLCVESYLGADDRSLSLSACSSSLAPRDDPRII